MQQTPDFTPKAYLMVNKLLHSAILMGSIIISVVFLAITKDQYFKADFSDGPFMLMVPIVTAAGLVVGGGIFKVFVKQAKEKESLKAKLTQYRVATIVRLALAEGPALFGAIAFIQEGNQFYLGGTLLCVLVMLIYAPSEKKIIKDLDLRNDELGAFKNKESKVK